MSDTGWLAAASAFALAGMGWLSLTLQAHWSQVMHQPGDTVPGTRRLLRVLGTLAQVLSLSACLRADRPSMAALVWVMLAAGSAVAVAGVLAWRPRLLGLLWPFGMRSAD